MAALKQALKISGKTYDWRRRFSREILVCFVCIFCMVAAFFFSQFKISLKCERAH